MAHIVLVNPYICDFAAFDLWQKPLGLLYLGAVLREHGHRVTLLDCLDRYHPMLPLYLHREDLPWDRTFGTGKYPREEIEKPEILKPVQRKFCRYGIPLVMFHDLMRRLDAPDLILMTSAMTYWYRGIIATVSEIKKAFPGIPVILGGIYASLCTEHAREATGADYVFSGEAENAVIDIVNEFLPGRTAGQKKYANLDDYPFPALDLYPRMRSMPLLTTRGCPLACTFCASKYISGEYRRRDPELVALEIAFWLQRNQAMDFAFFDDALLTNTKRHFLPMMERVIGMGKAIRFHCPNGLSPAHIGAEVAECMKAAGFETLRLSLETVSPGLRNDINGKVTDTGFIRAVKNLKSAGFRKEQIGTYILIGLPGQSLRDVLQTIRFAAECGVKINIAQFSPIPGTVAWDKAVQEGSIPADGDLLLTNNTLLPLRSKIFTWEIVQMIKELVAVVNSADCLPVQKIHDMMERIEEQSRFLRGSLCENG